MKKRDLSEYTTYGCVNFIYDNLQESSKQQITKERVLIILYKFCDYEYGTFNIKMTKDPLNLLPTRTMENDLFPIVLKLFEGIGTTITLDVFNEVMKLEYQYEGIFDWDAFYDEIEDDPNVIIKTNDYTDKISVFSEEEYNSGYIAIGRKY
jgi:hypothetical protein